MDGSNSKSESHSDEWKATVLFELGNRFHDRGKHSKAEEAYFKAIDLYRSLHGENNITVAGVRNNLGMCLLDQRKYDQAEMQIKMAYGIWEWNAEGRFNERLAVALSNIGNIYEQQARYAEAEEYFV